MNDDDYPCAQCGSAAPCPHDPQPLTSEDEALVRAGRMGGPATLQAAILLVDILRADVARLEGDNGRLREAVRRYVDARDAHEQSCSRGGTEEVDAALAALAPLAPPTEDARD